MALGRERMRSRQARQKLYLMKTIIWTGDIRCQQEARHAGLAYPRTCEMCGLGPCKIHPPAVAPEPAKPEASGGAGIRGFTWEELENQFDDLRKSCDELTRQRDNALNRLGEAIDTLHISEKDSLADRQKLEAQAQRIAELETDLVEAKLVIKSNDEKEMERKGNPFDSPQFDLRKRILELERLNELISGQQRIQAEECNRQSELRKGAEAELAEAKLQSKHAWDRHAEKDAAYGDMIKQRDELTALLATARNALVREHTSHHLKWNPEISQWETAYSETLRILTAALKLTQPKETI